MDGNIDDTVIMNDKNIVLRLWHKLIPGVSQGVVYHLRLLVATATQKHSEVFDKSGVLPPAQKLCVLLYSVVPFLQAR